MKSRGQIGMRMGLSAAEGMVLHGLLEEAAGDIVIKMDGEGFLVEASSNFKELGFDLSLLLLLPHIADLAEPSHSGALREYAEEVLSGRALGGWIEFPVAHKYEPSEEDEPPQLRWYALSLRPVLDDHSQVCGAVGLLRSVQNRRSLEGELHTSVLTNPVTGLANRHAFCASIERHLARGGSHSVAILAVDRMRAMLLQYGQRAMDEIQWGFARFLERMIMPGHELAHLDSERYAVIMPDMTPEAAGEWTRDVLQTFSSLTIGTTSRSPRISASAGLAAVEGSVDGVLRQAEMALVMARAKGGMQCSTSATPWKRDCN